MRYVLPYVFAAMIQILFAHSGFQNIYLLHQSEDLKAGLTDIAEFFLCLFPDSLFRIPFYSLGQWAGS